MRKILQVIALGTCFLLTGCQTTPPSVTNNYYNPTNRAIMPPMTARSIIIPTQTSCRITCFSYDNKEALHPIGNTGTPIYVKGFVTVPGKFDNGRICRPRGYETADIS